MVRIVQHVSFERIKLEEPFRRMDNWENLRKDICIKGLQSPLLVEKTDDGIYLLIEGYRRYWALESLKVKYVPCFVQKESSKDSRILKRLNTELHTKKRSSAEIREMVAVLLENHDETEIAEFCNVSRRTISQYVKDLNVDIDWRNRAKAAGVSERPLTVISQLELNNDVTEFLKELYCTKEITGLEVTRLVAILKKSPFDLLSNEEQKVTIMKLIRTIKRENDALHLVVHRMILASRYHPVSHRLVSQFVNEMTAELKEIYANHHFTDHLSRQAKNKNSASHFRSMVVGRKKLEKGL